MATLGENNSPPNKDPIIINYTLWLRDQVKLIQVLL